MTSLLGRRQVGATKSATHPVRTMIVNRAALGVLTLLLVSIIIFVATEILPGNAATAILGRQASPENVKAMELRLGLDQPALTRYVHWFGGVLHGDLGTSLSNGTPIWTITAPRLENSAVIVFLAGFIGTVLGVALGLFTATRRGKPSDHVLSIVGLSLTALPEFVVAMFLVILFATGVWEVLPAVSILTPGQPPWSDPAALILPVATLVIVIFPYIYRMMRAATIEALESDYVEMAHLKGLSPARILFRHALPNSLAPTVQVIGLNFLYLAGGIVLVEYVFNYPGIGQGLVNAVTDRDIPQIQFIVLVLAAFYVVVNILSDVVALLATPRRRLAR